MKSWYMDKPWKHYVKWKKSQKITYYVIPFTWKSRMGNPCRQYISGCFRLEEMGREWGAVKGYRVTLRRWEVSKLTVMMFAQFCEYIKNQLIAHIFLYIYKKYIGWLIWLCWVLVAVLRVFAVHCGMQNL